MATWKVREFGKKVHGRKQKFKDTKFETKEEAEAYADQFNIRPQVFKREFLKSEAMNE
ncbi:hypothetical protein ACRPLU_00450 [Streptococcus uberis]|uniref:hypothetical protein n=1 Tax=Streptococcus uberis TaxID=1349 RepID=UPI003D6A2001